MNKKNLKLYQSFKKVVSGSLVFVCTTSFTLATSNSSYPQTVELHSSTIFNSVNSDFDSFSLLEEKLIDSRKKDYSNIDIKIGVNIYVDDRTFTPTDVNGNPVLPFIYNGTTYLPARAIANVFGANVKWDGKTQSVYIEKNQLDAQNDTPFRANTKLETQTVSGSEVKIYVDGKLYESTDINGNLVPALVINGTTYLPARALCNVFNMPIEWDEYSNSVFIGKHITQISPGIHDNNYQIEAQKTLNYCELMIHQIEYDCNICELQMPKVYDIAYNRVLSKAREVGFNSDCGIELMKLYNELVQIYDDLLEMQTDVKPFELESLYQIYDKKEAELSALQDDYDLIMFNKFIEQCYFTIYKTSTVRISSLDSTLETYINRLNDILKECNKILIKV